MPSSLVFVGAFLIALAFFFFRFRQAQQLKVETRVHGFAAIRVLYPDELKPYFGVYVVARADLIGYALFILLFSVGIPVFFLSVAVPAFTFAPPTWALVLAFIASATLGAGAIYAEVRSKRIIGPDVIEFVSPFRVLSWAVPLLEVTRCEVVPGSPHARLRVYTRRGSRSLPLTDELWRALSAGYNLIPRSS